MKQSSLLWTDQQTEYKSETKRQTKGIGIEVENSNVACSWSKLLQEEELLWGFCCCFIWNTSQIKGLSWFSNIAMVGHTILQVSRDYWSSEEISENYSFAVAWVRNVPIGSRADCDRGCIMIGTWDLADGGRSLGVLMVIFISSFHLALYFLDGQHNRTFCANQHRLSYSCYHSFPIMMDWKSIIPWHTNLFAMKLLLSGR